MPEYNYEIILKDYSENQLYFGENLDTMRHLFHNAGLAGKIKLIYIDPPYGTNSVFQSRNQKNSYKDDLTGSHYIEFMRKRLIILQELLSHKALFTYI